MAKKVFIVQSEAAADLKVVIGDPSWKSQADFLGFIVNSEAEADFKIFIVDPDWPSQADKKMVIVSSPYET